MPCTKHLSEAAQSKKVQQERRAPHSEKVPTTAGAGPAEEQFCHIWSSAKPSVTDVDQHNTQVRQCGRKFWKIKNPEVLSAGNLNYTSHKKPSKINVAKTNFSKACILFYNRIYEPIKKGKSKPVHEAAVLPALFSSLSVQVTHTTCCFL